MMFLYRCLLLFSLFAMSFAASAFQSYQMVGEGNMRWLVFPLYQARLLTPDGYYQKDTWPLALELTYQRDIKKTDLIKVTEDEWRRMKVSYSPQWLDQLDDIWPDVVKGDVLLFHVDSQGVGHFYHNSRVIGSLADKAFNRAFLSIWLSGEARNQPLKNKLIGIKKSTRA